MLEIIVASIVPVIAGSIVGIVATRLRDAMPSRRLWALHDASSVTICLSSWQREGRTPLIGEDAVESLSRIIPSIMRGYRDFTLANVTFATKAVGAKLENDLLMIGGPANNPIAREVLDRLGGAPVAFVNDVIEWRTGFNQEPERFESEYRIIGNDDRELIADHGIVIRTSNPFNPQATATILAGSNWAGTVAAARHFVSLRGRILWSLRRSHTYVALVRTDVVGSYAAAPSLVHRVATSRLASE